jgi:hypothetical protein
MKWMSTRTRQRSWPIFVLAILLGSSGLALAGAVSLQGLADEGLTPSAVPALLGPITEAGRKGWECVPERAAAAKSRVAAELPADGPTP